MLLAIVFTVILSLQLVSVRSGTVEKCLESHGYHKKYPSPEGPGFASCLPWKNMSCCSADTANQIGKTGEKLVHIDWDYCGKVSQPCRKFLVGQTCLYFCDPNLAKWQAMPSSGFISGVPICNHVCDEWFEACKNDMTYSSNWVDSFIKDIGKKGPITHKRCRTYGEIFRNGEGLCNKLSGPAYTYEESSNCMVFDFKGENPNDKVKKTQKT